MSKFLFHKIKKGLGRGARIKRQYQDINPEDIFLDSTNLPGFEPHALEGRSEKPMSHHTFALFKVALFVVVLALVGKLGILSIVRGSVYAQISEQNRLEQTLIFANRGAILDRYGLELATNDIKEDALGFAGRHYAPMDGLAHVVGYIKYPLRDKAGIYYDENYRAKDGAELFYDDRLKGRNGLKLKGTEVEGRVTSESVVDKPQEGATLTLSIDAYLTQKLFQAIKALAQSSRFLGGAGVIMDVSTGEILALTSYPEYNQNDLTYGIDQKAFNALLKSPTTPFL